jgi:hypothetical protein
MSHTSLRFFYDTQKPSERTSAIGSSELRTGYSYLFDNWNRFLAGPSYNFDLQTIGAYVGYMIVYEHLHVVVGVSTPDVFSRKLGVNAYFPFGLAFWRF